MNLGGIPHHGPGLFIQLHLDVDRRRQRRAQEFHGFLHHGLDLHGRHFLGVLTAERQDLAHHFFGTMSGHENFFQVGTGRVVFGKLGRRHLGKTDNW